MHIRNKNITEDFSFNRLTLSYKDKGLEGSFKKSYFESNLSVGRVCHIVAIMFYWIVGFWNAIIVDSLNFHIWIIVTLIITAMFLTGLAFSYISLKLYSEYWQQIFAFYVLATGTGFAVITVCSENSQLYNFAGIIFCLIFCYAFIRLTFIWATIAGSSIVILYTVLCFIFKDYSKELFTIAFFYMSGINFLCMMVCYSLELMYRRDFMLNCLLKDSQRETEAVNQRLENTVEERTKELRFTYEREKDLVKKLEKEGRILQQSLRSLEQAETIAKLGYFEYNLIDNKTYWSKGFFRLLNLKKEFEYLDYDNFLKFVYEDDREMFKESFSESITSKKPFNLEFKIAQTGGEVIQVHGICDHTYDESGQPLLTRGVFQDITERKDAEESLRNLEAKLVQAQKMESVGRLAGGIAHDYNNISSIIIGYSELALEALDESNPLHTYVGAIYDAAVRATDLTRQLLAFARKQAVAPKIIDLNSSIDNIIGMLRRLIGEDIDLKWIPSDGLWPVKIDPSQIDQILANLCVNSRDAIPDIGKITIETKNRTIDEEYCEKNKGFKPGDFVQLTISDNGRGMSDEIINNIFEPFFTTKNTSEGTGLGLATVYGIVKQNHGFINVYSEPEKGTSFSLYIPRNEGVPVSAEKEITNEQKGLGETVLIVEDDNHIMKLGVEILERLGYNVEAANSPNQALEMVKKDNISPHMLLTDVVMPEMNGRELSEKLKEIYPDLKVLFMSGYTENVISHHGVLEEGVNFVSKPFSKKDLSIKVKEVLKNQPSKEKSYEL